MNTRAAVDSARDVMRTIDGVKIAAQETSGSSINLVDSANKLGETSSSLKQEVTQFLRELRTEAHHKLAESPREHRDGYEAS